MKICKHALLFAESAKNFVRPVFVSKFVFGKVRVFVQFVFLRTKKLRRKKMFQHKLRVFLDLKLSAYALISPQHCDTALSA